MPMFATVNTDELRALADEYEGTYMVHAYWEETPVPDALRTAADALDNLRTLLENAPHDSLCNGPENLCRCWKADAL